MFGFLNVNKVKYQTSREVVNLVQRWVKPSKVGHGGTLDPLATGILVIGVGPATRLTQYVQRMPKTYVADFRLGFESDTEDVSGKIITVPGATQIEESTLAAILPEFIGQIEQHPPRYSALKIDGERAYALARKGKPVKLSPRTIEVYSLKLTGFEFPDFQVEIRCGSGTYVRSLGRDIGRRLASGAIMTGLRRTEIGNFGIAASLSSDSITPESIEQQLALPQLHLGQLKKVLVSDEQLPRFANGCAWTPSEPMDDDEVAAIDQAGRLLTILKRRAPDRYTPNLNFSHYWLQQAELI